MTKLHHECIKLFQLYLMKVEVTMQIIPITVIDGLITHNTHNSLTSAGMASVKWG